MEKVSTIASYIYQRYLQEYGKCIDEMKLHKLLYFIQRESFIQTGAPIFNEQFEAWQYGPVMPEIRRLYKNGCLTETISQTTAQKYKQVFDKVFETYAPKASWSLSSLTHGEYCWETARKGISENENSNRLIDTNDIKIDAERIKIRRLLFDKSTCQTLQV